MAEHPKDEYPSYEELDGDVDPYHLDLDLDLVDSNQNYNLPSTQQILENTSEGANGTHATMILAGGRIEQSSPAHPPAVAHTMRGGRSGPLSPEERERRAIVRDIRACDDCRRRKIRVSSQSSARGAPANQHCSASMPGPPILNRMHNASLLHKHQQVGSTVTRMYHGHMLTGHRWYAATSTPGTTARSARPYTCYAPSDTSDAAHCPFHATGI
jgi:hypothetical protein